MAVPFQTFTGKATKIAAAFERLLAENEVAFLATVSSNGDHRLGMALAVAGLIAAGKTTVEHTDCIADSFPGFEGLLHTLIVSAAG